MIEKVENVSKLLLKSSLIHVVLNSEWKTVAGHRTTYCCHVVNPPVYPLHPTFQVFSLLMFYNTAALTVKHFH